MAKILVLHLDCSQLGTIVSKVNSLNKKSGPFDTLLLLGENIIQDPVDLRGLHFDIPAYSVKNNDSTDNSHDLDSIITKNLALMDEFAVFTTAEGVKIAFITGLSNYLEKNLDEIKSKIQNNDIDILITYQWPKLISNEQELFFGDSKIDQLLEIAKPKYHFACGSYTGKFFERAPFQWEDGKVTRFISLAKYGGSEKWIYAFNLTQDLKLPTNLSPNPFIEEAKRLQEESKKRKLEEKEENLTKRVQRKIVLPENCFFCLSNPKLQSHMIISINEHAYLTVAKGPLTRPTDTMKFSGHVLIIPIEHVPNLPKDTESQSVTKTPIYNEVLRYEASLVRLFASFKLATVFFQINKSDSVHFHIQGFPLASDFLLDFEKVLEKNVAINNKRSGYRNTNFKFEKFVNAEDEKYLNIVNSGSDYVQFTTFDQSIQKQIIYISVLEPGKSLDLQFGRRVLAYLLQTPKRIKWDTCQQSEERETLEAETFKTFYEPFDFSLAT